jgi:hypothetical protein
VGRSIVGKNKLFHYLGNYFVERLKVVMNKTAIFLNERRQGSGGISTMFL